MGFGVFLFLFFCGGFDCLGFLFVFLFDCLGCFCFLGGVCLVWVFWFLFALGFAVVIFCLVL